MLLEFARKATTPSTPSANSDRPEQIILDRYSLGILDAPMDDSRQTVQYTLTVLVAEIKRYEQFLHDTLFKLPGITHVRSRIVLKAVKSAGRLPLPGAAQAGAEPAVVRAQRRQRG